MKVITSLVPTVPASVNAYVATPDALVTTVADAFAALRPANVTVTPVFGTSARN